MVTHIPAPESTYGQSGIRGQQEPSTNLIVMHARESKASHIVVIDPVINELDATGSLLGAQGFKVTMSSALLDMESIRSFEADLLVLRPPATVTAEWRRFIQAAAVDLRLRDVPAIWLVNPGQQVAVAEMRHAHILTCPWKPFEFLTLVDSLLASSQGAASSQSGLPILDQELDRPILHGFSGDD